MKDFVKCNYCGEESFIEICENVCPRCLREGTLQWATVECDRCGRTVKPQEVEEFLIDESCGLKGYICDSCIKEQEDKEDYYESILDKRLKTNCNYMAEILKKYSRRDKNVNDTV